tara:strand:- start:68 stop:322 length:255 start_codon:yes stop_codon:yes gene_type:complete
LPANTVKVVARLAKLRIQPCLFLRIIGYFLGSLYQILATWLDMLDALTILAISITALRCCITIPSTKTALAAAVIACIRAQAFA